MLAVFQALGVNRRLYALVFGESVLNDAVAIVLFHVVLQFQDDFTFGDVLVGVVFFLVDFLGSLFIGLVVGFAGALLFKYTDMGVRVRLCGWAWVRTSPLYNVAVQHPSLVNLERSLTVLIPFVAYMLAQGFELSGVVAILFAGMHLIPPRALGYRLLRAAIGVGDVRHHVCPLHDQESEPLSTAVLAALLQNARHRVRSAGVCIHRFVFGDACGYVCGCVDATPAHM